MRRIDRAIESLSHGGRVLVSRLQYLGDVILTLPLVDALKKRFPGCEIDYLAKRPGTELLDGEPAIAKVHCVPEPHDGAGATMRLVRELRGRQYAAAIDLLSNPRSALLLFLSGAPTRLGGTRRIRRHLYTHTIHVPGEIRSAVAHHLYYIRALGADPAPRKPVISISKAECDRAQALLEGLGIDMMEPRIGIHPGGKWEVKRWPLHSFSSLAVRLKRRRSAQLVVFQGPGDRAYTDGLKALLGKSATYLPELSARSAAAIMRMLDAGVYCDGAAMHMSVAVGTPTVGIFGSSEPEVWFPYESFGPYRAACVPIACRPCHIHSCDHLSCLRGLSVESVEQAVAEVLGRNESSVSAADTQP